jgi:hypothetical protein
MKTTKWFVVASVIFSSFPILAQQANANAQQSTTAQAPQSQANASTSGSASVKRGADGKPQAKGSGSAHGSASAASPQKPALQPVSGELVGKLDSKSAKVGDSVVIKTTQAMRTADGTELPKGTRLLGHVTSVQPHRSKNDDGDLGIAFDRAMLKGGNSVPIHSVIESVAPSPSAMALANAGSDSLFDGPMGGGMMAGGGSAMGGGGLVGGRGIGGSALGGSGALVGGATSMASAPTRTVSTSAVGSGTGFASAGRNTLGGAGNVASTATGSTNGLRGSAAGAGLMAAHATAIPGVLLAGDATGAASGTLTATRKNVHLDSGTQMVLGIAAAANR